MIELNGRPGRIRVGRSNPHTLYWTPDGVEPRGEGEVRIGAAFTPEWARRIADLSRGEIEDVGEADGLRVQRVTTGRSTVITAFAGEDLVGEVEVLAANNGHLIIGGTSVHMPAGRAARFAETGEGWGELVRQVSDRLLDEAMRLADQAGAPLSMALTEGLAKSYRIADRGFAAGAALWMRPAADRPAGDVDGNGS